MIFDEVHAQLHLVGKCLELDGVDAGCADDRFRRDEILRFRIVDIALIHANIIEATAEDRHRQVDVHPIETAIQQHL